MFDVALRRLVDPALFRMARVLARARFSANALTITGAAIGLGAAFFITQAHYPAALACVVLNRLFDGLDGAIARINGPTDFGGYLDSLCDFLFYVSALVLVATFTLTAVSFLGYAAIAARRNDDDGTHGPKAFIYSTGLMEGGETIAFFLLFCLFPAFFPTLALIFAALCVLTVAQRVAFAARSFN